MCHVLRDLSKDLYQSYVHLFGAERANQVVKNLIPLCIAERWGSCHECEVRLETAGCSQLYSCLHHILIDSKLLAKMLAKRTKTRDSPAVLESFLGTVNELAQDKMQEYSVKMGKYRKHALAVTGDSLFQAIVYIMNRSRAVIMHYSAFLKVKQSQDELERNGSALHQLINGTPELASHPYHL